MQLINAQLSIKHYGLVSNFLFYIWCNEVQYYHKSDFFFIYNWHKFMILKYEGFKQQTELILKITLC